MNVSQINQQESDFGYVDSRIDIFCCHLYILAQFCRISYFPVARFQQNAYLHFPFIIV